MNASLHGWLVIDKPSGMSSCAVVSHIKRFIHTNFYPAEKKCPLKVGHGGTLDPLATGVLPIAIGEATKTVPYIMDALKEYSFVVTWGENRTTQDAEGDVTETSRKRPSLLEIKTLLPKFQGALLQMPPAYCALKIQGERAYARARAGQEVHLSPRSVYIEDLSLTDFQKNAATFFVRCAKGTYVRSLARDLAKSLGTCGHVTSLKRIKVGLFDLSRAISLDNLQRLGHKRGENFFSLDAVLDDIPAVRVSEDQSKALKYGQKILFSWEAPELSKGQEILVVVKNPKEASLGFALYKPLEKTLHLKRGFNVS